jgi:hypothetical protein
MLRTLAAIEQRNRRPNASAARIKSLLIASIGATNSRAGT